MRETRQSGSEGGELSSLGSLTPIITRIRYPHVDGEQNHEILRANSLNELDLDL